MESKGSNTSDFITRHRLDRRRQSGRITGAGRTNLTKKDVVNMLQAFRRFFENAQQVKAAGFIVSG